METRSWWRSLFRECLAECFGVYIMILFGLGSMAQMITSRSLKGEYLSTNFAFALATTFAMYITRGVSGAQLNPAISFSMCVMGRHQWSKFPFYTVFQLLGSFLGAATTYALYYDAIMDFSRGNLTVTGPTATAQIFATYPAVYLSIWNGFLDQVIGTGVLVVCLLSLADQRNSAAPAHLEPLLVGVALLGIGVAMGSNCGYPLNPARDLGPRVFTYIAGWGGEVFSAGNWWFWVPLVAPFVGALMGVALYLLFVELHHPAQQLDPGLANKTPLEPVELSTAHLKPFSQDAQQDMDKTDQLQLEKF